jgi:hypothetical protein
MISTTISTAIHYKSASGSTTAIRTTPNAARCTVNQLDSYGSPSTAGSSSRSSKTPVPGHSIMLRAHGKHLKYNTGTSEHGTSSKAYSRSSKAYNTTLNASTCSRLEPSLRHHPSRLKLIYSDTVTAHTSQWLASRRHLSAAQCTSIIRCIDQACVKAFQTVCY